MSDVLRCVAISFLRGLLVLFGAAIAFGVISVLTDSFERPENLIGWAVWIAGICLVGWIFGRCA